MSRERHFLRALHQPRDMLLDLDPQHIHLWSVFTSHITEPHLLTRYRAILSAPELAQMQKFRLEKDRHRYLLSRTLVRSVLSSYVAIAPADWRFRLNAYGKPEIANRDRKARGIMFNLSHTQDLIVLGVTYRNAVGVDTENLRIRPAPLKVAERFFSPEEVAALYLLPAADRHRRFYQIWTLKEAYIKARGRGLSIPLNQFRFDFQHESAESVSVRCHLRDNSARWQFWQYSPTPDYLTAICAKRSTHSRQRLIVKKGIPLETRDDV
jgi:4'-phosphopantetheinyl transferase